MQGHNPVALREQAEAKATEELKAKVKQEQWTGDLRYVLADRRGRRLIWRLMEEAGVFRETFSESHAVMAFNAGNRRMGLFLLLEIERECPERLDEMRREQRPHGERAGHAADR